MKLSPVPFNIDTALVSRETFDLTVQLEGEDGVRFPFGDYRITYRVSDDEDGTVLTLDEGAGITTQPGAGTSLDRIIFRFAPNRLDPGHYHHLCLAVHRTYPDNATIPLFGGRVDVTEGG